MMQGGHRPPLRADSKLITQAPPLDRWAMPTLQSPFFSIQNSSFGMSPPLQATSPSNPRAV